MNHKLFVITIINIKMMALMAKVTTQLNNKCPIRTRITVIV